MAQLDHYLEHLVASGASDLHISAGEPVRMRVDGDLVEVHPAPLSHEQVEGLLFEMLDEVERERFIKNKNLDRSYSIEDIGNFRFNFFLTRRGMAAVIRAIPTKIPTMEELGLPETVQRLAEADKGLILVTGPTGSGKSTTLASMLHYINTNYPYHILTVEDPVEFVHHSKRSLVNQREIGPSCHTFADALKFALREDPDVILVGELRDLETMALAMTAAETGHLVFGTLHTRGAAASVDRLIDSFPANQQPMIRTMLSESLIAVISQALLKKAGGKGRVAAYEIMVTNHAISNLIREGKTFQIQSTMQTGRKEGMILMDQYVRELMANKVVSVEDGDAFLQSIGKGEAAGKGKLGTPALPAKTVAQSIAQGTPPPPAVRGFVPEPLEVTNHGLSASKPAVATPIARASAATATSSAEARPLPASKPTAVLPPIGRAATPPPAGTRPVGPPALVKPAKGSPSVVGNIPAGTPGKFAPLSENIDRTRQRPTPPSVAKEKENVTAQEIPQSTLLTDLTKENDDKDQPTVLHLSDDPKNGNVGPKEVNEIDLLSLSLPEVDEVIEDPNEPLNPPAPPLKKKTG